jgi:hypothetical protein
MPNTILSAPGHALAAHDCVLYACVLMTNPLHLPITLALLRMLDCIDPSRRN